ncbi:hypothetical protein TD95_003365 [Thielaviopsis punctulata]|uniref:Conserved oligomeric Golgi complex subunit 8 n=1 Tax=Thielaviopsis punctulata TaxID=72032 RepID=A0A0F4ZJZ0_9PEZI|nr:hypothetical protein TD95_003365 [Thielaviopsis punctulata]
MSTLLHNVLGLAPSSSADAVRHEYLVHLTSLTVADLQRSEPERLSQASHTSLLAIQGLSKRSHKAVIDSVARHATLRTSLPALSTSAAHLKASIPQLDVQALKFSETYSKAADNEAIARRRQALLLLRNVERISDLMELPTLLSSAASATPANHTAALDLSSHVRRIHGLYPNSHLISAITSQSDEVVQSMTANLLSSLKTPTVKLAASLRAIGSLRRALSDIPEVSQLLGNSGSNALQHSMNERALGTLFLLCRLDTLTTMLAALEPLRKLADDEKVRQAASTASGSWSSGQQTERYLKRFIEIFREQSFGIVSMYKSLFASPDLGLASDIDKADPLQPSPAPLSTFSLHLVDILMDTLRSYLPAVRDRASRDSILTQVLYCAGSLGRLGIDFSIMLAELDEDEWVDVVKRHRLLAGRLESVLGDFKSGTSSPASRKSSLSVKSAAA